MDENIPSSFEKGIDADLKRALAQTYSDGGTYNAPQLLSISYDGKTSLQIGDTLKWTISVLQGSAPLALIMISLLGPYSTTITVKQQLFTPIGFGDNTTIITNQTVSYTITDPWANGSYTHQSIALETQACPLQMTTQIYSNFAYAMATSGIGTAAVSQRLLAAFPLPALTFGSGQTPAVTPPVLLSFALVTPSSASIGGEIRWNFTVQAGSSPLASVTLQVIGPQLGQAAYGPLIFGPRSVTVAVGSEGLPDGGREGAVVAGSLSLTVTPAWLPGVYNPAGSYPSLVLAAAAGPPPAVTANYNVGGAGYMSPYVQGYTLPAAPSFTFDKLTFEVTAAAAAPPLAGAQLLSLEYTGPAELRAGDRMTWAYSLRQGSGPAVQILVALKHCVSYRCSYVYLQFAIDDAASGSGSGFGFSGSGGGGEGAAFVNGSVVAGELSAVAGTAAVLPPPTGSGSGAGVGSGAGAPSPMIPGVYTYDHVTVTSLATAESDRTVFTNYMATQGTAGSLPHRARADMHAWPGLSTSRHETGQFAQARPAACAL